MQWNHNMHKYLLYVLKGPYALFDPTEFQPLDPTQEPIFPPELMVTSKFSSQLFQFSLCRSQQHLHLCTSKQIGFNGFVQALYNNYFQLKRSI